MKELVARVEDELGPLDVVVFNAGAFGMQSILDLEATDFEALWRINAFAGFLVGREAARGMAPRGKGTILFTGATASLRGGARFDAIAETYQHLVDQAPSAWTHEIDLRPSGEKF